MNLKTYRGKSMAEALQRVKSDLGPEAVILHTRTLKRGGVLGVGARMEVEITASKDPQAIPADERNALNADARPVKRLGTNKGGLPTKGSQPSVSASRQPSRRSASASPSPAPRQRRADAPPKAKASNAEKPTVRKAANMADDRARFWVGDEVGELGCPASASLHAQSSEAFESVSDDLQSEMREIRSMVKELLNRPRRPQERSPGQTLGTALNDAQLPEDLREYYTKLLQNAVAEEIAREVITKAQDRLEDCGQRIRAKVGDQAQSQRVQAKVEAKLRELVPAVLMECVERMLPTSDALEINPRGGPKVVALVGPTGVGKTTTIAKLAAHFTLRERKKVGLITIDTFRIAAMAQLKAYADIMNLPLEVVFTPDELAEAVGRFRDCDLILVDTSGRSHRDVPRLNELRTFLDAAESAARRLRTGASAKTPAPPSKKRDKGKDDSADERAPGDGTAKPFEVHLLLSCTCDQQQLLDVAERFAGLGVDHVAFTKLDEAVGTGVILNVASQLNWQLSYLTTGQDVPDDIEVGHRRRIAELLLRGEKGAADLGRMSLGRTSSGSSVDREPPGALSAQGSKASAPVDHLA